MKVAEHGSVLHSEDMTTVIRVKRKRDCEPAEALLLAARKKLKTDPVSVSGNIADVIDIEEKVFHFAATVEPNVAHCQDVVAGKVKVAIEDRIEEKELMKRMRKRKLPSSNLPKFKQIKSATISVCQSIFQDKCLNLSTADESTKDNQNQADKSLLTNIQDCDKCIIYHHDNHVPQVHKPDDNDDNITCNNTKMVREKVNMPPASRKKPDEWVYDLYYCRNTYTNWDMSELLYIQPYRYTEEDLINYSESEDEYYEDEDDSNDEGNWRNDYPDEDDKSSRSSSSSEDERERFMEQEEEEEEEEDEVDNQEDNDDFIQLGMEDLTIGVPNQEIEDFYDQGADNEAVDGGGDYF